MSFSSRDLMRWRRYWRSFGFLCCRSRPSMYFRCSLSSRLLSLKRFDVHTIPPCHPATPPPLPDHRHCRTVVRKHFKPVNSQSCFSRSSFSMQFSVPVNLISFSEFLRAVAGSEAAAVERCSNRSGFTVRCTRCGSRSQAIAPHRASSGSDVSQTDKCCIAVSADQLLHCSCHGNDRSGLSKTRSIQAGYRKTPVSAPLKNKCSKSCNFPQIPFKC